MKSDWIIREIRYSKEGAEVGIQNAQGEQEEHLLPVSFVTEERLSESTGLSDAQLNEIRRISARYQAYRGCLRKLSVKDRTEKEISDFLAERDLSEEDCTVILQRLKKAGYVNDEEYAETKAADMRSSLYGKRRIRNALKEKGIDESIIRTVLDAESPEKETERGVEFAGRELASMERYPYSAKKARLKQKCLLRGYSAEEAERIISRLEIEKDPGQEDAVLRKSAEKAIHKYARKYEKKERKSAVIRALLAKGFEYDDILKVLEQMEETE